MRITLKRQKKKEKKQTKNKNISFKCVFFLYMISKQSPFI